MPSLEVGGAERSLIGLLSAFDYSKVDISIMIFRHSGELFKEIPNGPNVLPEFEKYKTFDVPIRLLIHDKKILFAAARIAAIIATKLYSMKNKTRSNVWMHVQYITRFLQPFLPKIPGEYDLGIMFLGVGDTLIKKVSASQKITWCHTDYNTLIPNKKMDLQTYKQLDYVVTVSDACKKSFDTVYPEISSKSIVIENILSKQYILRKAQEHIEENILEGKIKLISVGRFCEAKNFDSVPMICKLIRNQALNVVWFLIGYGSDEELIRQKIHECGMEPYVKLLGKKENPYPYIQACDVYVQPSRYEGKCVAVREAQMLGKPVIITNYPTSASQLEDGVDGLIVPQDNEGCAAGIAAALRNPPLLARLAETCRQRDYSNAAEVEKIYALMEQHHDL